MLTYHILLSPRLLLTVIVLMRTARRSKGRDAVSAEHLLEEQVALLTSLRDVQVLANRPPALPRLANLGRRKQLQCWTAGGLGDRIVEAASAAVHAVRLQQGRTDSIGRSKLILAIDGLAGGDKTLFNCPAAFLILAQSLGVSVPPMRVLRTHGFPEEAGAEPEPPPELDPEPPQQPGAPVSSGDGVQTRASEQEAAAAAENGWIAEHGPIIRLPYGYVSSVVGDSSVSESCVM